MKVKKIIATALAVMTATMAVSITTFNTYAARTSTTATFSSIGIMINGKSYDVRPVIINGVSYFPVRTIGNALNCKVDWVNEPKQVIITSQSDPVGEDNFSQSKDGSYGTKTAIFDDSIALKANGNVVNTPVAIVDDRSYVPIKAVAEAMGKRATWYEESKTIKIVNPQTAQVDDSIKDYYVYDLPEIKNDADYLVGNWVGHSTAAFDDGDVRESKKELFISKNPDGTYKIISKSTITKYSYPTTDSRTDYTENYSYIGKSSVKELKGYFDPETNHFTTEFVKDIYHEKPYGAGYQPDVFLLKGERLYWLDGGLSDADTIGELERF